MGSVWLNELHASLFLEVQKNIAMFVFNDKHLYLICILKPQKVFRCAHNLLQSGLNKFKLSKISVICHQMDIIC